MFSRHALASILIATTVATSIAASAQADSTTSQGQQKPKKQKAQSTKGTAETKSATSSTPPASTTTTTTQPTTTKKDEGIVEEAKKAVDAPDTPAARANAAVVGSKAHSSNEQRARDPNLRPKDNRDAHQAGEAVGRATTTAAVVVGGAVQDTTRATDGPGSYRPFALEWNPLGLIVGGRVSIQAEWAPVTHHVILLSPHFVHTTADVNTGADTTAHQSFTGGGAELGYRYYTGHRGMNGFFIGPSFIAGAYNAALQDSSETFTNFGVALDVGVQAIVANHLVLGGGVGIEYLNVSHDFGDLPTAPSQIAITGVKPRLLFSAGYGF